MPDGDLWSGPVPFAPPAPPPAPPPEPPDDANDPNASVNWSGPVPWPTPQQPPVLTPPPAPAQPEPQPQYTAEGGNERKLSPQEHGPDYFGVSVTRGSRDQYAIGDQSAAAAAVQREAARLRNIVPPTPTASSTADQWSGPVPFQVQPQPAQPQPQPPAPATNQDAGQWSGPVPFQAQPAAPTSQDVLEQPMPPTVVGPTQVQNIEQPSPETVLPVPTTVGSVIGSTAAGLGSGAVTTAGQAIAGPGHMITGGTALAGHLLEQAPNAAERPANMLALFDWIDKGGQMPRPTQYDNINQNPDWTEGLAYEAMSPEERAQARQHYQDMASAAAAMPPLETTGLYKTGQAIAKAGSTVGETVAAPGEYVVGLGQKITPPAGYEGSTSFQLGQSVGSLPVYIGSFWLGGPLAGASVAGSQAYSAKYKQLTDAGVAPEDAAVNAGLNGLVAGGMMTLPAARWIETLSGALKKTVVATATRMATDGVFLTGVSEAQKFADNLITKATTNPNQDILEGVGDPKQMAIEAVTGMVPGGTALAYRGARRLVGGQPDTVPAAEPAPGPTGPDTGAAGRAEGAEAAARAGGGGAEGAPPGPPGEAEGAVPRAPAIAPDAEQAKAGLITPEEGRTLIRTTDSSGNNWVGHNGVLVNEGRNPEMSSAFSEAERTQPVTTVDAKPMDDVLTSAHVDATTAIKWADQTHTAPDGREMIEGRDAEGHVVDLPVERYHVLGQYGDVGRDAYLSARPGEAPIVALRDPSTQTVTAIAQARPPQAEAAPIDQAASRPMTFEERDQAAAQQGQPVVDTSEAALHEQGITPEEALAARGGVPRSQRQPGIVPPDITDRPSLYREAYRDAGYDPDVMVNRPITEQQDVLQRHVKARFGFSDVEVDPKMQPHKAVDSLLDAYRNLQWMAHTLGYPEQAMSLGGRIKLRLEPWQANPNKAYLGMYSYGGAGPGGTIHMPDRSNSFAHEWTHALDHELLHTLVTSPAAKGLLTSQTREGVLAGHAAPGSVMEAFANVMRAIFHERAPEAARIAQLNMEAQGTGVKAQRAAAEAQRLVAGAKPKVRIEPTAFVKGALGSRDPRYYAMPEELLARSGEAFVAHEVAKAGGTNEFITKGDLAYLGKADQRFQQLYPQAGDRDNIFRAFRDLHDLLQKQQTFGRGPAAQRPGDADILDPIHWRNISNTQANPQLTAGLRRAVVRNQNWFRRMMQNQIEGAAERAGIHGQPRGPRFSDLLDAKDVVMAFLHTAMGNMDVFRERYHNLGNHRASQVIQGMMDRLGYQPGTGRLQGTPFLRLERQLTNIPINKLQGIYDRNGIPTARLDNQAEWQLTQALRGRDAQGNTPVVPPNIQKAAGEIRALLNERGGYQMEQAGIPIGFVRDEGYFPIAIDRPKVLADGKAAEGRFTRAMVRDFDAKLADDKKYPDFLHKTYNDIPRNQLPKDVHDAMTQLAQTEEAMRAEAAKPQPDPTVLSQLDAQRQMLLDKVVPPIRDAWAPMRGKALRYGVEDEQIPWEQNRSSGVPISPFHERVLSPEARDDLLGNSHDDSYLISRPSEMLPHYFQTTARTIAWHRSFGQGNELFHQFLDNMRESGITREHRDEIMASVEAAMGLSRSPQLTQSYKAAIWGRTLATMSMLGRATWASTGEPMITAVRTGNAKAGLAAYSAAIQNIAMQLHAIKGSERLQHLTDIAHIAGITSSRLQEHLLNGNFASSPGRTMSAFFRRTWLTQITNANKVGAIQGAHEAMKIWSRQIISGQRGALFDPHGELRELGIPNAEHADFAKWITDLNGALPGMSDIHGTPEGRRWLEAVHRFVDHVVLEPTAAEKSRHGTSMLGRFVYALMSYNFAFQRLVLNPGINRLAQAVRYEQGRFGKVGGLLSGTAKWGAYAGMSAAALMLAQLPTTILRQEIFDHDRAQQWRDDGSYFDNIMGLAYSRTGLGGIADPLINAYTGLRYEHDLSSLALGATANYWVQAFKDLIAPGTSPDTNTATYKRIRGGWELFGAPVAALATALLPGGPIKSWLYSLGGQFATSPGAGDLLAHLLVGPKGEKTNLTPQQQREAERQQMFKELHPDRTKKKDEEEGGTGGLGGILGLVDDFLPAVGRSAAGVGRAVGRAILTHP